MIAVLASALVITGAALVLGSALVGRLDLRIAPAAGLAALLVTAGAVRPLGSGVVGIALALGTLAPIAALLSGSARPRTERRSLFAIGGSERRSVEGEGAGGAAGVGPAAVAALVVAALLAAPFVINDRVGALGAGLVNDDMASHLLFTDWVANETGVEPELVAGGYPLGPHSLVAGISEIPGIGFEEGFGGLTLAIGALAALTVFGLLAWIHRSGRRLASPSLRQEPIPGHPKGPTLRVTGNRPLTRPGKPSHPPGTVDPGLAGPARSRWAIAIAAAIAALVYMNAAWLAQGAFKEPILALILLGFAALLTGALRRGPRSSILAAVLAAGAVYLYSFPGLFWLAAAGGIAFALAVVRSPATLGQLIRELAPAAIGAGALIALLSAPDWPRLADFASFEAFDPDGDQTGLGNLRHSLSPLEALGIWPSSEFRASPGDASAPALAFYLGAALALSAVALGAVRAWRRREHALLAAAAAAIAMYLVAEVAGTPYTAAKALAIAAVPLAALAALGALTLLTPTDGAFNLGERGQERHRGRWGRVVGVAAAAGLGLAALGSSLLVLREAPVRPGEHSDELAQIRAAAGGGSVLFLGRDDFIAYELRGSRVSQPLKNFYEVDRVTSRFDLPPDEEKFDFDAVPADAYARFDYVLTTSSPMIGDPPQWLEEVERTRSYVLWERVGAPAERLTLAEGASPGAVLDCERDLPSKQGTAAVWHAEPIELDESGWAASASATAPGVAQSVELPGGEWTLSLAYDSPRPLSIEIDVKGGAGEGASFDLAPNLDFRGPTPYFPAGAIALEAPAKVIVTVSLEEPSLLGRLAGSPGEAHLRGLAFSPNEPVRELPIGRACGRYVDWYARR